MGKDAWQQPQPQQQQAAMMGAGAAAVAEGAKTQDEHSTILLKYYGISGWLPMLLQMVAKAANVQAILIACLCLAFLNACLSGLLVLRGVKKVWPKSMEIFSVLLFGVMVALAFTVLGWLEVWQSVVMTGAYTAFMLFTLAIRRPFTQDISRDSIPREMWRHPAVIRLNDSIAGIFIVALGIATGAAVAYAVVCPGVKYGLIDPATCPTWAKIVFNYMLQIGPLLVAIIATRLIRNRFKAKAAAARAAGGGGGGMQMTAAPAGQAVV